MFIKYCVFSSRWILESLPHLPRQHSATIGFTKGLLQRCRRGRGCTKLWKNTIFPEHPVYQMDNIMQNREPFCHVYWVDLISPFDRLDNFLRSETSWSFENNIFERKQEKKEKLVNSEVIGAVPGSNLQNIPFIFIITQLSLKSNQFLVKNKKWKFYLQKVQNCKSLNFH